MAFGFVAMVKGPGHEHWKADPKEMDAWADNAAQLLGKIPVQVAESALNASAGLSVAVGLGTMVQRRVVQDRQLAVAQGRQKPAQAPRNAPTRVPTPATPQAAPRPQEPAPAGPDGDPAPVTPPPVRLDGILA